MDLWNSFSNLDDAKRSSITGYTLLGGICNSFRYSIVEDLGFNNIQNAAHELGHK